MKYLIADGGVFIDGEFVAANLRDPRYATYRAEVDPDFDLGRALVAELIGAVQRVMDAEAQALGYDDLKTAITYRGDPNPKFAAEAEAFFSWRSAVWTQAYEHLALVQAGSAPMPTVEEAIAMMPALGSLQ